MHRRAFLVAVATVGVSSGPAGTSMATTRAGHSYGPLGRVDIEGARDAAVDQDGGVAYVAATDGFVSVDVSDDDPEILATRRDIDTGTDDPFRGIWDVWPSGDRLVVAGPAQPMGASATGFALFDVGDPADPSQVAFHATDHYVHNAFFTDGTVYLTGSGRRDQPVVMVDVSDDDPEEVGRWSLLDHDQQWAEVSVGLRNLHDVFVQNDIAYLVHWDAGTWIVDVSDPTDPDVLANVSEHAPADLGELGPREGRTESGVPPGNGHYSQVNEDGTVLAVGREAWAEVADGERIGGPGGVDLYDVTDKTDPTRLASIEAPASFDQTRDGWFTTAHNFDLAGDRLYTSWYFGGVKIHDISDPEDPRELAWWRDPGEASFWTARMAVPGEYFVASSSDVGDAVGEGTFQDTQGALYVFPDREGTQSDPPDLTDPTSGEQQDPERQEGGDDAGSDSDSGNGETATNGSGNDTGVDGSGPGFGVLASVIGGLGAGAWGYRRARNEQ